MSFNMFSILKTSKDFKTVLSYGKAEVGAFSFAVDELR